MIERIEADVNSIGRIQKSIKDDQLLTLLAARDALSSERRPRYNIEGIRIERIFRAYHLW